MNQKIKKFTLQTTTSLHAEIQAVKQAHIMSAVARAPTALMLAFTLKRSLSEKKPSARAHVHAQGLQGVARRQQLELPPCIHQKDGCGAMEKSTVPQCPSWTDLGHTEENVDF